MYENFFKDRVTEEDDFNLNALALYPNEDELAVNDLYIGYVIICHCSYYNMKYKNLLWHLTLESFIFHGYLKIFQSLREFCKNMS